MIEEQLEGRRVEGEASSIIAYGLGLVEEDKLA